MIRLLIEADTPAELRAAVRVWLDELEGKRPPDNTADKIERTFENESEGICCLGARRPCTCYPLPPLQAKTAHQTRKEHFAEERTRKRTTRKAPTGNASFDDIFG